MATDRDLLANTIKGELVAVSGVSDCAGEVARMLRRRTLKHTFPLTAAVNTNIAEAAFDVAITQSFSSGYKVLAANYTHSAANTTASNTSPITLTLKSRNQGGATVATIGTVNTAATGAGGVGGFVQWNTHAFTLTPANAIVNTNSMLTMTATLPALDTAQNVAVGFVSVEIEAL